MRFHRQGERDVASPGDAGKLSFERDIKPLFRAKDRESMLAAFDLFDHADVVEHADRIVGASRCCGIGDCAACTVLIDGRNTKACQARAGDNVGKTITTVEGASGPVVDAVRDAWYRGNVVQCGYCQPGQTLAAAALLESDRSPDEG